MSLQFNSSSPWGLVQHFEEKIGANQGDVSASTTKLKRFTALANVALDEVKTLARNAAGAWQHDDSNHTDYPERTMNLVSGTRRYKLSSLTADAGTNLLLGIYKLYVADADGIFRELQQVDVQNDPDLEGFYDGQDQAGTPYRYDIVGDWLDLDPVPNYSVTGGIKVEVDREPKYFVFGDTTAKAGIAGNLHPYLYLKPAYEDALIHSPNLVKGLQMEVEKMERNIIEEYSRRNRNHSPALEGQSLEYR